MIEEEADVEAVHNPAFPIDRKVWVPQVAMLAVFLITVLARKYGGLDIPTEIQVVLTTLVGGLVGWLVPMARAEITSRLTNSLIEEAQADPVSPVNLVEIVDDKIILAAQINPASPATIPHGETVESLTEKLAVEELKPAAEKV